MVSSNAKALQVLTVEIRRILRRAPARANGVGLDDIYHHSK
jgi:hypothetical protein